jgi:hypothetical protein
MAGVVPAWLVTTFGSRVRFVFEHGYHLITQMSVRIYRQKHGMSDNTLQVRNRPHRSDAVYLSKGE